MRWSRHPEEGSLQDGASVNGIRLLAQCRIQSIYLSHGAVVGGISGNDIDLVGIVFDAVKDSFSQWTVITSKLIVPTTGVIL